MSPSQESLVAADEAKPAEELGFAEALGEIEEILAKIEGSEVDIDALAEALGRAANLLEVCRAKIRKAESEVEQVSQRLLPVDD